MGPLALLLTVGTAFLASEDGLPKPNAAPDLVLLVTPAEKAGVAPQALLDSVAIYTRDLRVRVQLVRDDAIASEASSPSGARDAAAALLRTRGARLAFWLLPGAESRSLALFVLDARGVLRKDLVSGAGPHQGGSPSGDAGAEDLNRAVALKLRAILTGDDGPPERASPPAAGPPEATPKPAVRPVASTPPKSPAPTNDASIAIGKATPPARLQTTPALSWQGIFGAAGYRLSRASGSMPTRQSVALHALAAFDWPVEIDLGVDLAPAREQSVSAGTIAVRDIPVRLGGRFAYRGRRVLAGIGAFGALHILSASASSPDGRQDSSNFAGGLGVEAVVRGALPGGLPVLWEARAWGERLMTRTRFLIAGNPASDTGTVGMGVGLGVAFPTR